MHYHRLPWSLDDLTIKKKLRESCQRAGRIDQEPDLVFLFQLGVHVQWSILFMKSTKFMISNCLFAISYGLRGTHSGVQFESLAPHCDLMSSSLPLHCSGTRRTESVSTSLQLLQVPPCPCVPLRASFRSVFELMADRLPLRLAG